jgi:hypothetical protein
MEPDSARDKFQIHLIGLTHPESGCSVILKEKNGEITGQVGSSPRFLIDRTLMAQAGGFSPDAPLPKFAQYLLSEALISAGISPRIQ